MSLCSFYNLRSLHLSAPRQWSWPHIPLPESSLCHQTLSSSSHWIPSPLVRTSFPCFKFRCKSTHIGIYPTAYWSFLHRGLLGLSNPSHSKLNSPKSALSPVCPVLVNGIVTHPVAPKPVRHPSFISLNLVLQELPLVSVSVLALSIFLHSHCYLLFQATIICCWTHCRSLLTALFPSLLQSVFMLQPFSHLFKT